MTTYLCHLSDVKVETNNVQDTTNDALLTRHMAVAAANLQAVTGRQFFQVSKSAEVWRSPRVSVDRDGTLRVLLRTPRITALTALAWRAGSPAASWVPISVSLVDWESDPLAHSSLVRAYAGLTRCRGPLWAQVSYGAGWLCDFDTGATDLPPDDLQEVAIWWTGYLYRTKDAPFEKTANPLLGTVTIPSAMPPRLKAAVERWKEHPVV